MAPATEEALKASFVLLLFYRRRIEFIVDAGPGIRSGRRLRPRGEHRVPVARERRPRSRFWLVRGLDTAVLHGTTTSVCAMVTKALIDNPRRHLTLAALPGLGAALVIHSAFNHVLLPPLAITALLLLVVPVTLVVLFQQSERATAGMGRRRARSRRRTAGPRVIQSLCGHTFRHLPAGTSGQIWRSGGRRHVCLLRLELDMSIQSKAMLLAREAGLDVPVTGDLYATLDLCHRYLFTAAARKP